VFQKQAGDVLEYRNALQANFPEHAMFVFDLCLQTYILQRVWNTARRQRFVLSFGWGNLGSSLPMAIGMLTTGAEKQVVCVLGDGAFSYDLGDLSLLNRLNPTERKLTIVLFNNSAFGTLTQITGEPSYAVINPDYAKLVAAFGLCYCLANERDFDEKLKACALVTNAHCLVEVVVEKDPVLFNKLRYE
jgi:acetolactate synthase-1/2/3 large subunit